MYILSAMKGIQRKRLFVLRLRAKGIKELEDEKETWLGHWRDGADKLLKKLGGRNAVEGKKKAEEEDRRIAQTSGGSIHHSGQRHKVV